MTLPKTLMAALVSAGFLAHAQMTRADTLRILAPDLPGTSEPGGEGRDAETVRRVLDLCGYDTEFVIQPFGRHILSYRDTGTADAVMTVPLGTALPGHATAAYIWYQNGAFYDANRIGEVATLADLWGRNVVTFKDGVRLLELGTDESRFGSLSEIANQRIHSHLLFLGRVDAILADGLIVAEVNRQILRSETRTLGLAERPTLRFSPIFHPSPYMMVFREAALAEAFDGCYDRAYAAGMVTDIDEKYIGRFQDELGYRYLGF